MDGDDGASLFEGMEFVTPVMLDEPSADSATPSAEDAGTSLDHAGGKVEAGAPAAAPRTDSKGQPSTLAGTIGSSPSQALDADLFSSLDIQPALDLANGGDASVSAQQQPATGSSTGVDRALPVTRQGVIGSGNRSSAVDANDTEAINGVGRAGVVRKKKKSIRVGYARDGDSAVSAADLQASLDDLYAAGPRVVDDIPATSTSTKPSSTNGHSGSSRPGDSCDASDGTKHGDGATPDCSTKPSTEHIDGTKRDNASSESSHSAVAPSTSGASQAERLTGKLVEKERGAVSPEEAQESSGVRAEERGGGEGQVPLPGTKAVDYRDSNKAPDESTGALVPQADSIETAPSAPPDDKTSRDFGLQQNLRERLPERSKEESETSSELQGEALNKAAAVSESSRAQRLKAELQEVLRELESAQQRIQGRMREVVVARKAMGQRKRDAAQALAGALTQLQQAEADVAAACEREDFEAADTLSQKAEELQRDVDGAGVAARFAEEECNNLLEEQQSLSRAEVDAKLAALDRLDAIYKEASLLENQAEEDMAERAREELERVQVEEETLEAKKRKIALEQRVLEEQEAELARKVDALTQQERGEKERLLEGKEQLQKELEALLELVREKEAEIEAQAEKIRTLDGKIGAVAGRFDKVRAEMERERERVHAMVGEAEEQEAQLAKARAEVEEARQRALGERAELGRVIEEAGEKMRGVKEGALRKQGVVEEGESVRRRVAELAEEEKTNGKDAQEIQESAASFRTEEQELATKVAKLQQEASQIAQRLALASRRIPELELEKKQAAAARNFKDAARLAAEAKLLANDKAAATEEEKTVTAALEAAEKELAMKAEEILAIEAMAKEKKQAAALARCTRLWLEAAAVRREMEAAAEMEDFEEAECLRIEAETADKEVEQLCALHEMTKEEVEQLAAAASLRGKPESS